MAILLNLAKSTGALDCIDRNQLSVFIIFIIIFILSLFYSGPSFIFLVNFFYFLSSARTAPEPGHSRLIDPGREKKFPEEFRLATPTNHFTSIAD